MSQLPPLSRPRLILLFLLFGALIFLLYTVLFSVLISPSKKEDGVDKGTLLREGSFGVGPEFSPAMPRVINGNDASPGRYDYFVLTEKSGGRCGGSLIADNAVLTAAHCKGKWIQAGIGMHNFRNGGSGYESLTVLAEIPHPKYAGEPSYDNDVMVVILEERSRASPVCIADDSTELELGERLTVMGFGVTETGDPPEVLKAAEPRYISNDECDTRYGGQFLISENMMCGFSEMGADACQGDSGGPLVRSGAEASGDVVVGVVSWGVDCGSSPGVYSRLTAHEGWIKEVVRQFEGTMCGEERISEGGPGEDSMLGMPDQPDLRASEDSVMEGPGRPGEDSINDTDDIYNDDQYTSDPTGGSAPRPTLRPTLRSTFRPTLRPTLNDTNDNYNDDQYTSDPTGGSAPRPTLRPTLRSTFRPTLRPTLRPTPGRTPAPQKAPTPSPTSRPTDAPTSQPTGTPTSSLPSYAPTASPTHSWLRFATNKNTVDVQGYVKINGISTKCDEIMLSALHLFCKFEAVDGNVPRRAILITGGMEGRKSGPGSNRIRSFTGQSRNEHGL
eukprot:CAMPEP_0194346352 /NCGR_PEP_ID=MMETSP0171-20130528/105375_1 /TAXON_ID=218684 /ORGANISM="Corethron pennatum, Strain L29A3" /LENGTH=557 /DNA_ID=CAMNT_0039113463 /DNA_START=27 /DNA_END=1701 /DNA_ORIENTATION=+